MPTFAFHTAPEDLRRCLMRVANVVCGIGYGVLRVEGEAWTPDT
jgi:hypothetical protein